ncbi:MarR family winged helix-turn-helix transcriptional regulator [Cohaesibacter haloalkalitolerans]|uniref:MarR family winged helix-turn-helix transcriptional regulator n=1 Tax=Cohaesibacter haloalkalitolerans TaxID=1162980 RepID=UPI000E65302D|nr:MarR family transcriptional regulator [Cohaesibacter haloalkalitolerans]
MKMEEQIDSLEENWPEAIAPHTAFAATVQRLASLIHERSRHVLKAFELTFTEFDVLAALRTLPHGTILTPSALYDALLISSGGLTKTLKSLEGRGLIERPQANEDARQRPIALTDAGRRLMEEILPKMQAMDKALLQDAFASDDDCMAEAELMRRIVMSVESSLQRRL